MFFGWSVFPSPSSPLHVARDCPRPVTNRELAWWIAQGKGEMLFTNDGEVCDGTVAVHSYEYDLVDADNPVPANVLVRTWGRDVWVPPTRSYLGLK